MKSSSFCSDSQNLMLHIMVEVAALLWFPPFHMRALRPSLVLTTLSFDWGNQLNLRVLKKDLFSK